MAMDLITSSTAGAPPSSVTGTQTPDSDTETPPTPLRHCTRHHAPPMVVSYKECLKNHVASSGGHALDGCCEFMPGPTASPTNPTSLTCAACGCHRNFHRRDPDDPTPLHHLLPPSAARLPQSPPSASQILLDDDHRRVVGGRKKRFRTKFRQEQKEKMQEFAEKIGWRLRRGEEKLVEDFCRSVGVRRGVFKVWMHNNKINNNNNHNDNNSNSSSCSWRREKEKLHRSNGSCAAVVFHEFHANGHGPQEAQ